MIEVNLDEYFSSIIQSIGNTYISGLHNIKIQHEFDPVAVDVKSAASLGLMLNELLINSLKYAFPEGSGTICIGLKRNRGGISITVSDNGVGLPDDFSLDRSDGFGIQLITMLVSQMDGSVTFSCGEGTEFIITLPNLNLNLQ
jgi:two-component sensor histidine kinase